MAVVESTGAAYRELFDHAPSPEPQPGDVPSSAASRGGTARRTQARGFAACRGHEAGVGEMSVPHSRPRVGDDEQVKVESADGVWYVRRRWAPRRLGSQTIWAQFVRRSRKARKRIAQFGDIPDAGCAPDLAEGIVVVVVLVALSLFLIFIGIPFLVALGELLLVVVLAFAGIVGRVFFRRPWTVDAVSPSGAHHDWSVVGWKASEDARQFVGERIAASGSAPTAEEVSAALLAS